jgi:hypothetical protein
MRFPITSFGTEQVKAIRSPNTGGSYGGAA